MQYVMATHIHRMNAFIALAVHLLSAGEAQAAINALIVQKKNLLKMDKYKKTSNRIFEESKDGVRIEKIKIDFISHINYI